MIQITDYSAEARSVRAARASDHQAKSALAQGAGAHDQKAPASDWLRRGAIL